MNYMVDLYFSGLRGKRVAVLGIGVSNRPLIRMLLSYGICVTACDKAERGSVDDEVLELERDGAELRLGATYLDDLQADVVFRTPGMHPDIPALVKLREAGAAITSEMEAFFAVCPCKIIAVTGSDGKTTTTTLIAQMLKQAGKTVWLGGNIGQPLLPLAPEMKKDDIAVVELSSFQLMQMKQSAHIAVVTNLTPNHLDVHKDMAEYIDAKKNIFRHQTADCKLVLNMDDETVASFAPEAKGTVVYFSRKVQTEPGTYLQGDDIYCNGVRVMSKDDILLPGMHNVENYMAAMCAVSDLVEPQHICAVAREFGGVEHRIELVRVLDGIRFYNDSIASSPTRTIAGLHAFDQKIILIAGGYDKHIPFDVLGPEIVDHVKHLILCGDTAQKIKNAVVAAPSYNGAPEIEIVEQFEDAVTRAYQVAQNGDVVSLSPACAAFDKFKNFMVRGKVYKELVRAL